MTRNIILVAVLLVAVLAGLLQATDSLTGFTQTIGLSTSANTVKIDSTTNTVKMDGTTNTVKIDGTTNTVKTSGVDSSVGLYGTANVVQECTYATWSQSDVVASTNAVAITALTGRDLIEIRAGPTATEDIWVGIGVTPAVASGICVTAAAPFRGKIPAGVAVSTIASGAFYMSVTQAAY